MKKYILSIVLFGLLYINIHAATENTPPPHNVNIP
jgi:hypothetical protein